MTYLGHNCLLSCLQGVRYPHQQVLKSSHGHNQKQPLIYPVPELRLHPRGTLTKVSGGLNLKPLKQLRERKGLTQRTLLFKTFLSLYDAYLKELKLRLVIINA